MRAVTATQQRIEVVDKDIPTGDGVLLAVTTSGICGSDLHLVAAGLSGVTLGHEFGGRTPDGHLVAVRPTGHCGTCASCRAGHPNTCRLAVAALHGTSIDGGLAEFALIDHDRLVPMPDGVDEASVALVEPLAVAVHGVNRVAPESGAEALVVGAGTIGLLTAAVLVSRGVSVDIVARHPHQALAAEALGARVVGTSGSKLGAERGYGTSFDAVSSQEALDTCVRHTRPRGSIVEFGLIWSPVGLTNSLLMKEITLVPTMFYSHGHDHDDFADAAGLLARAPAIHSHLVTHRFPLEDAAEAFRTAADRASGALKVHLFTNP